MSSDESAAVLEKLLANHPELVGEAESVAKGLLEGLSFEAIAEMVESELNSLGLDDVLEGSGGNA